MRTGNLFDAVTFNQQFVCFRDDLFSFSDNGVYPFCFVLYTIQNSFGDGDRRSAWSIELMDMVDFFDLYIILFIRTHCFCQQFVDMEKYIYPNTEVGAI